MMMFPNFKYRKNFYAHEIAVFILHFIPAFLIDVLSLLNGKRKFVLPIAKKFRQACLAGKTFSLNEWIFKNQSRYYFEDLYKQGLYKGMRWNLQDLNYDSYIRQYVIGIQTYIHKEKFNPDRNKLFVTRLVILEFRLQ